MKTKFLILNTGWPRNNKNVNIKSTKLILCSSATYYFIDYNKFIYILFIFIFFYMANFSTNNEANSLNKVFLKIFLLTPFNFFL